MEKNSMFFVALAIAVITLLAVNGKQSTTYRFDATNDSITVNLQNRQTGMTVLKNFVILGDSSGAVITVSEGNIFISPGGENKTLALDWIPITDCSGCQHGTVYRTPDGYLKMK